jgi:hypothetical protein
MRRPKTLLAFTVDKNPMFDGAYRKASMSSPNVRLWHLADMPRT